MDKVEQAARLAADWANAMIENGVGGVRYIHIDPLTGGIGITYDKAVTHSMRAGPCGYLRFTTRPIFTIEVLYSGIATVIFNHEVNLGDS